MDLLYMPLLDLQQHLKQELLTNPFLELQEPEDEEEETAAEDGETETDVAVETTDTAEQEATSATENENDWEEILLDGFEADGGTREQREEREYTEPVTVEHRGLADHLREQVSLLDLSPRELVLADEFIGNIDDDGYLKGDL